MLILRLGIFAALFGIALTGLFWLLGNLSEPELLRSKKAIVVKGCEPIENDDQARLCPPLFCQKFLLESRTVEMKYRFTVAVDQKNGTTQLIGGSAKPFLKQDPAPQISFACLLEGGKVLGGKVVPAERLTELSSNAAEWQTLTQP